MSECGTAKDARTQGRKGGGRREGGRGCRGRRQPSCVWRIGDCVRDHERIRTREPIGKLVSCVWRIDGCVRACARALKFGYALVCVCVCVRVRARVRERLRACEFDT